MLRNWNGGMELLEKKQTLSYWNGPELSEQEVITNLKVTPGLFARYSRMDEDWKQRFMDFCCGRKTLLLTYDPFFKKIFNPDVHPDKRQERKGLYIPGYEKGVYHRTV